MSSFGRFQKWYIEWLHDDDVASVLHVITSDAPAQVKRSVEGLPPDRRREKLLDLWRHKKIGVRVSRHFAKFHEAVSKELVGKRLAEIEESIPSLTARYGAAGVAFALITSGNEYQQDLGYRIMRDHPDPVRGAVQWSGVAEVAAASETPATEVASDLVDGMAAGSISMGVTGGGEQAASLVEEFAALLDKLESNADRLAEDQLEPLVTRFYKVWEHIKSGAERRRQLQDTLASLISTTLEEFAPQLSFWGIEHTLPREATAFVNAPLAILEQATEGFAAVRQALARGREMQAEAVQASSLDEFVAKLQEQRRYIQSLAEDLSALVQDYLKSDVATHTAAPDEGTIAIQPSALEPLSDSPSTLETIGTPAAASSLPATVVRSTSDEVSPETPEEPEDTPAQPAELGVQLDAVEEHPASIVTSETGPDSSGSVSADREVGLSEQTTLLTHPSVVPSVTRSLPQDEDTLPEDEDTSNLAPYEEHIARAIADGDFGTAYWLAREAEAASVEAGDQPPGSRSIPPSWVLRAAALGYGADWNRIELTNLWFEMGLDHPNPFDELSRHLSEGWSARAKACLIAAGSLVPALFAPETGASDWLRDASENLPSGDPLRALLDAVHNFASRGRPLDISSLDRGDQKPWPERLEDVRTRLSAWRQEMEASRNLYPFASQVSTQIASSRGPLAHIFDMVLLDEPVDEAKARRAVMETLGSRADIEALVHRAAYQVPGRRPRVPKIEGTSLAQLIRKLESFRDILQDWLDTLQAQKLAADDWYTSWVRSFRQEFTSNWRELRGSLRASDGDGVPPIVQSLYVAVEHLFADIAERVLEGEKPVYVLWKRPWPSLLRRPVLLLEHPPIDEKGSVELETLLDPRDGLLVAIERGRTLRDAFEMHLAARRFLAASCVLEEMAADGSQNLSLMTRLADAWADARLELGQAVHRVRALVEQAYIEHVLEENQKSDIDARILAVEERLAELEDLHVDLSPLFGDLEQVERDLAAFRRERIRSLEDSINALLADGDLTERAGEFAQRAREALARNDIPAAEEYITFVEGAQRGEDAGIHEHPANTVVREFVDAFERIGQALEDAYQRQSPKALMRKLSRGYSVPGIPMGNVPGSRYNEIKTGLEAYYTLKRPHQDPSKLVGPLEQVLSYMGFIPTQVTPAGRTKTSYHFKVEMTPSTRSPLADFGSSRRGHYDVVIVYDRPSAEVMGGVLHHYRVATNAPIILYPGRISRLQREEWSAYCWTERLTAMLVDEILLHFLAGQRETRLPAAVSCGVAWGYCVPYRSFGDIPPEIFKGRSPLVTELARPEGRTIVYGGRQFGKSVLLRMVEREFHRPEDEVYVFYHDIKFLGEPLGTERPSDLWVRLRDRFAQEGLINKALQHPDSIAAAIVEAVNADARRRVILLLDEADNFFNADAASRFAELERLRSLRDRTDGRIKVVFSGLHNVQRFYSISNHPFAQLGAPIVIGPLSPKAARELIVDPLAAIGFSFGGDDEDDDERRAADAAVLRILSYTNYHPALIQHFCAELIHLVRQTQVAPPYRITVADVEAVYRKPEVRAMMKERFEMTIILDNRYKVIVYGMIFDQLEHHNGFRKSFTVREIAELVRELWPEGFEGATTEDVKTLLDELIGLGVLVRLDDGSYRLRNGNVVRALGTKEEIIDRLEAALQERPQGPQDHERFRFKLDRKRRSPLTVRQLRALTRLASGVGVIFGSRALLDDRIQESLERFAADVLSGGARTNVHVIPTDCVTLDQLFSFVRKLYGRRDERHIVYCPQGHMLLETEPLDELMGKLNRYLRTLRSRSRSVRVLFSLGVDETVRWFEELGSKWRELEEALDVVVTIQLWDRVAVDRFLLDEDMAPPVPADRVMAATGGWPYLIETLMDDLDRERKSGGSLPKDTAGWLTQALVNNDRGVRDGFVAALCVDRIPAGRSILRTVAAFGSVSWEDVTSLPAVSEDPELVALSPERLNAVLNSMVRLHLLREGSEGLEVDPLVARAMGYGRVQ